MRRIFGSISRRESQESADTVIPNGDSPEASVARGVRLFCESGGPNNSGEEVLHLPLIVEAAESSPGAAREAAVRIRKFLSRENHQRAYVQYNAIMLVRILADNPGQTFTKNMDHKFVSTTKELLREGRDMSVQQILRETLDSFEVEKAEDENLLPLRQMWSKEKTKYANKRTSYTPQSAPRVGPPVPNLNHPNQQNYFTRNHKPRGLPPPDELAQRIEEARTSGKLLLQVVQSTPVTEVMGNELIKEFVERCRSASASVQGYIHSDNPPPDEDTLLTLIETNDQLATALSRHQRALLQARRITGAVVASPPLQLYNPVEAPGSDPPNGQYAPPPMPPPGHQAQRQGSEVDQQDPFDDRNEAEPRQLEQVHPPLEPQGFGLPPPRVPQPSIEPEYQAPQSYMNKQNASSNNFMPRASPPPIDQQPTRKPVQYRF